MTAIQSLPVRKVALVGPLPPPFGGMANQTRQLAEHLRDEGWDVEVIQTNRPYRPAWVERIPVVRAVFRLLPYLWALWNAAGRQRLFHILANSGWSWHLFAAPAVWIASLRGCCIVLNYRGGEAASFFARSFRWVAPTLKRCNRIIVPSGFLQQVFARYGIEAGVVPNPVDLNRFRFKRPSSKRKGPNLIVCRNLEPIYGIPAALRAFALVRARYPKARLWIAGTGPQARELQALAEELQIADAVSFTGRLPPEEIVDLYKIADVALNPATVDNAPNSLLEALAAEVPVVSTDAGGVPYLVQDRETALLVPVGDARAMAEAVVELLDNPALCEALKAAGRAKAEEHAWDAVKVRLLQCYGEALQAQRLLPKSSMRTR